MNLSPGTRIGRFEVLAPLGAGGMGEVYRAHDARLARDVALKVLPAQVATDPDRVSRFAREAQLIAALNHPHIAQIYGVEETAEGTAIVMELVAGPTLAERIAKGPIPLNEALAIAQQLCSALEAAHEKGIIHRDLKPANIKLRPDATVKVLDFGLAKVLDDGAVPSNSASTAMSPTLSFQGTQAGVIHGTAAYMSPEQAAGTPVDRRSDLWSFGVVLLEMLTGRPAFSGQTVSHVLAAVLKSEPDWSALPPDTPAPVRRLLRRCLEKDRRRRLDSAADARLEIEDAMTSSNRESVASQPPSPRRLVPVFVAGLAGGTLLAVGAAWLMMRPAPAESFASRFLVVPPAPQLLRISPFENTISLSSDGRQLIYSSRGASTADWSGTSGTLMVRPLDQLDPRPVASSGRSPFFSPDGKWIGFFDDNDFLLKKIPASGGPPISICRFAGGPRGAVWRGDGTIIFATGDPATGLSQVSANGGEPATLTTPDTAHREGDHLYPSVRPDGRGILFTIVEPGQSDTAKVAVLDGRTGERRVLIERASQAQYLATGHLVFAVAGMLRVVGFNLEHLQVVGDAIPVLDDVLVTPTGAAYFAVSGNGVLAYVRGGATDQPLRSLVWVDRAGREQPTGAPSRRYASVRLSPDGKRAALEIREQDNDIWTWDFAGQTLKKLTHGPALDQHPLWLSDGRVAFTSNRSGVLNLYVIDDAGILQRVTTSDAAQWPTSVTPDGSRIIGHQFGATTSFDLFSVRLGKRPDAGSPASGQASMASSPGEPLVSDKLAQAAGEVSPNGRFIAYQSNESGPFDIYVRPFPDLDGGKWQISVDGGTRPAWARSGRELFYIDRSGPLVAVPVETSGPFSWGKASKVYDRSGEDFGVVLRAYDVTPEGQRFLMLKESVPIASSASANVVIVMNWFEDLKRKLSPGR